MAYRIGESKLTKYQFSTALLEGGVITSGSTSTQVNISAGVGTISWPTGSVKQVEWDDMVNIEIPTIGTFPFTGIAIDENGDLFFNQGDFTAEQTRDLIQLGFAVHLDLANVSDIFSEPIIGSSPVSTVNDFLTIIGNFNEEGNLIQPVATDLEIKKTAGKVFSPGINWSINKKSPNTLLTPLETPITFRYSYSDGVGGYITGPLVTDVDPGQYDDGDGTLASVASNRYTVQRMYYFAKADQYIMTYGTVLYTSLAGAVLAASTENADVDPGLQAVAVRSYISLKGNTVDLSNDIENNFAEGPIFKGSSTNGGGGGAALPTTTKGDLVVHSDSSNVRLPVGNEGEVLTVSGASINGVVWTDGVGAENGLIKTGNNIGLGGTLTGNTTISGATNDLTINDLGVVSILSTGGSFGTELSLSSGVARLEAGSPFGAAFFQANGSLLEITAPSPLGAGSMIFNGNVIDISSDEGGGKTSLIRQVGSNITHSVTSSGLTNEFKMIAGTTTFVDAINSKGIEYGGDYSLIFTDNSLITKKYVDDNASVDATYNQAGLVKMSRDSATSTTYISFDGSDTPNVT
jgi:hypothetical protein